MGQLGPLENYITTSIENTNVSYLNSYEGVIVMKKKHHMSKWIIIFIILSIFSFTGLAIYLQFVNSIELSATLITCFYAFCTGELWMLASIKKAKIYNDIDNDGIPDDEDPYIDPACIKEAEEALEKLKRNMNRGE